MTAVYFVLYLLAFLCFLGAAIGMDIRKASLLALGLLFFAAVPVLQFAQRL